MIEVFIPPRLRALTGGAEKISIDAATVGDVVDQLERLYPGIRNRLCDDEGIRPELVVSVGDTVLQGGLHQRLPQDGEVHFLPALGGG